jgi:aspartate/methionine/tyrosine aminotransferase
MRFETIKFLKWFKTKDKTKIDLCRSGVEDCSLEDLNIDMKKLRIGGENSYGYLPLIEAIAARYKVEEGNVITTTGTSQAIFMVCAALLERGDEVLIEKPTYEPLLAVPEALEANVIRIERKFEDRYLIDLEKFESLISSRTKLVVLTNLHNPSGVLLERSLLKNLINIALEKRVHVLIDEIYLDFVEGQETSFSLADNVIVISSLTKVYGLGDLRCGWILCRPPLGGKLRRIIDYIDVEGVFIGEQISAESFPQLDSLREKSKPLLEENRSILRRFIQEEEKLSWVEPHGGVVCFPRIESNTNGDKLAAILSEKYETSIIPGSFFGEPRHFRLGFGLNPQTLIQGLENIEMALKEI